VECVQSVIYHDPDRSRRDSASEKDEVELRRTSQSKADRPSPGALSRPNPRPGAGFKKVSVPSCHCSIAKLDHTSVNTCIRIGRGHLAVCTIDAYVFGAVQFQSRAVRCTAMEIDTAPANAGAIDARSSVRSCLTCSKAKAKCVRRHGDEICERCVKFRSHFARGYRRYDASEGVNAVARRLRFPTLDSQRYAVTGSSPYADSMLT